MSQASDFLDHKWESNQSITYTFDTSAFYWVYSISSNGFRSKFEAAMSVWSEVANITFEKVSSSWTADLTIGWDRFPDYYGGTLGWAVPVDGNSNGIMESANGDFALIGMDIWDTSYFYTTAIHEIGHVLGLAHIDHTPSIMAAYENGTTGLTSYDISVIQELYGAKGGTTDTSISTDVTDATLLGSTGSDNLSGEASNDTIVGDDGQDTISGNAGNDIIYGNLEIDRIYGGSGNDTIYGGQNNGPASTGEGSASDGTLKQRDGVESISGGSGDDVVYGNYGSDLLWGNDGNDKIFGGQDKDTLSGGAGNDTLYGNRGDDFLIGGDGADNFISSHGDNTISDFNVSEGDWILELSQKTSTEDTSAGVKFTYSDGETVTLTGISSSDVTDNFFKAHDVGDVGVTTDTDTDTPTIGTTYQITLGGSSGSPSTLTIQDINLSSGQSTSEPYDKIEIFNSGWGSTVTPALTTGITNTFTDGTINEFFDGEDTQIYIQSGTNYGHIILDNYVSSSGNQSWYPNLSDYIFS